MKKWTVRDSLRPTGSVWSLYKREEKPYSSPHHQWWPSMISATMDVRSIDNFVRDYICSLSVYSPVDPSVCRPIEIPDVPLLTSSANTLSKLMKRTTTIYAFRLQLYAIDSALSSSSISHHVISRQKSRQRKIMYTLSIRLVNKSNYSRVCIFRSIDCTFQSRWKKNFFAKKSPKAFSNRNIFSIATKCTRWFYILCYVIVLENSLGKWFQNKLIQLQNEPIAYHNTLWKGNPSSGTFSRLFPGDYR